MRLPRILFRYILWEVVIYAALGFFVVSAVLITQNLLRRLEDLVAVGFVARDALGVLGCLFPMLAAYAVPVAFLFGVLVAMGRLSADSEVKAIRSCGLGLRALLAPVLCVALGVSAITAVLMIRIEPEARVRLRSILKEVASRGAVLEPGRFEAIAGRVVYVQSRDHDNQLEHVLIVDHTNLKRPFLIFAQRGQFVFDPDQVRIHLELENGSLHLERPGSDDERYRRISFQHFDYVIDASPLLHEANRLRPSEMTLHQLRRTLAHIEAGNVPPTAREQDPNEYRAQIQRRYALPFAPILFALIGVPVGLRRTRGARSFGTLLCVAMVFVYYMLLSLGQYLSEQGRVPALVGLWLPNAAFGLAALPLLLRARRSEV